MLRSVAGSDTLKPMLAPFHLAFPVRSIAESRSFYGGLLGCIEGRSSDRWVDFDFFGHQLVAHLVDQPAKELDLNISPTNSVDGHEVPIPHFGVVLDMDQWKSLADRLRAAGVQFVIEPYIRFQGRPSEQATMFLLDPSGNALEFKAFVDPQQMFAPEASSE